MKINYIKISGFRHISNGVLNFEDNITVLAGANNSGKTSIVELLNCVMNSDTDKLCGDDFSVIESQKWLDNIYPIIHSKITESDEKEDAITDICNYIFSCDDTSQQNIIRPIELKLKIDYDKEKDDIRIFADHLMDFNPDKFSLYYKYIFTIDKMLFLKNLSNNYDKLDARVKELNKKEFHSQKLSHEENEVDYIKEYILLLYFDSLKSYTFFCDENYENMQSIKHSEFIKLFNFEKIMAGRTLDDVNSDKSKILSKNMIDIASSESDWSSLTKSLPDSILRLVEDSGIKKKVKESSTNSLSETMREISKTSGDLLNNEIMIDINITEESIKSFLKNITHANYMIDEYSLKEASQGLGYSNLIYIHLQIEKYKKTINPLKVNILIIEEPESHMHPQMQAAFTKYIQSYFDYIPELQGLITTHSHEVVKNVGLKQLRVLRKKSTFECNIHDIRLFQNSLSEEKNKDLLDFYNIFYAISFPDIIFADKVILFEGDTERMMLKSILSLEKFSKLKGQYISFVQVGGAYAYNYSYILNYLNVKSLIITDIDYSKTADDNEKVLESNTTNSTIINFINDITNSEFKKMNVNFIYQKRTANKPYIMVNKNICLTFQGEKDGYSRTLEEAMLCKLCNVKSFEKKERNQWEKIKADNRLLFTIPNSKEFNIKSIVSSTAKNKTDFMYSAILNSKVEMMLPYYVEEGLKWLGK